MPRPLMANARDLGAEHSPLRSRERPACECLGSTQYLLFHCLTGAIELGIVPSYSHRKQCYKRYLGDQYSGN